VPVVRGDRVIVFGTPEEFMHMSIKSDLAQWLAPSRRATVRRRHSGNATVVKLHDLYLNEGMMLWISNENIKPEEVPPCPFR
jgi:hypothetical protein